MGCKLIRMAAYAKNHGCILLEILRDIFEINHVLGETLV